jgi:hypothetical protein
MFIKAAFVANMDKLRYSLIACAASLLLCASVAPAADHARPDDADDARPNPNEKPREKTAPSDPQYQSGDPDAVKSVPEQARQDHQYMAALKKCEALKGGEKQNCVQAAQRKYSRM